MSAKIKTRRGAAKRFSKTANGFNHKQAGKRHILTKKSAKRIRQLRPMSMVSAADTGRVLAMLPNL